LIPNGETEFYIDVQIVNPGVPTTLNGWKLSIEGRGKSLYGLTPRFIHGGFPIKNVFGSMESDDLSKNPIITGAVREARVGFTFDRNAQDYFAIEGTRFRITVEDVRRNIIEAEFLGS
jgi:hypothetical protein